MTAVPMRSRLRVEEPETPAVQLVDAKPELSELGEVGADRDRWRGMAVNAGERLAYAENQLKDLRTAADDARARFTKYKSRLDAASERVNVLQSQLIAACAERDALKGQLAEQAVVKQKVWEFRQSILDGPLFEVFGEYCK